ncbi:MAG TPA: histidine kinase dimerization/phospho-acceptor domain-containing protein, partial [Bryobacteraceae bacterium]|nr:histidine kinase dimerization/phospho-acceptor domain-containing protein [Bryobacteraceae bacterium]
MAEPAAAAVVPGELALLADAVAARVRGDMSASLAAPAAGVEAAGDLGRLAGGVRGEMSLSMGGPAAGVEAPGDLGRLAGGVRGEMSLSMEGPAAGVDEPGDLALLVEASSRLLLAQSCQDVLRTTIELGRQFIAADCYAIWQQNAKDRTWSLSAAEGLSEGFCQAHRLAPAREAPKEPVIFEDVEKSPYLSTRHEVLRAEGIRSMLIIPLLVLDEQPGTMVFYWHSPATFIDAKTRMAAVLGRLASCALRSAGTIERGTEELRRSQSALRQSNEDLRRANEDLNQFAHSASHDLREPLRSISIFSELLLRRLGGRLEPETAGYLENLMESSARMEALIRDLLAWSAASGPAGQASGFADARANANEAFEAALLNLKTAVEDTSAVVTRANLPGVRILPVHLSQVFQNLIGNALKYRRLDEAPRVHVEAARVEAEG